MKHLLLELAPSLARTTTGNGPRRLLRTSPYIIRQQDALSSSARRFATHDHTAALRNGTVTEAADNSTTQAQPLAGYYHDILSTRSPYSRQILPSQSQEPHDKEPTSTPAKPQTAEEKMAIVFGTRLAGPGRTSRYDPGAAPDATWKTINGVAIPPRPEEPDNCCMSGCVHCVWDDYRDELEEWAARLAQAKVKGSSTNNGRDQRQTPRSEVNAASGSMDDDGGGSETSWTLPDSTEEDLFANIPVGIREFMKTEKKLKQQKLQEGAHT